MNAPDFSFNVNAKAVVGTIGLLGPLVAILIFALQLRQDVRANTATIRDMQTDLRMAKERISALERTKLVFCIGAQTDSSSSRSRAASAVC